jgi:hypothetical protein
MSLQSSISTHQASSSIPRQTSNVTAWQSRKKKNERADVSKLSLASSTLEPMLFENHSAFNERKTIVSLRRYGTVKKRSGRQQSNASFEDELGRTWGLLNCARETEKGEERGEERGNEEMLAGSTSTCTRRRGEGSESRSTTTGGLRVAAMRAGRILGEIFGSSLFPNGTGEEKGSESEAIGFDGRGQRGIQEDWEGEERLEIDTEIAPPCSSRETRKIWKRTNGPRLLDLGFTSALEEDATTFTALQVSIPRTD